MTEVLLDYEIASSDPEYDLGMEDDWTYSSRVNVTVLSKMVTSFYLAAKDQDNPIYSKPGQFMDAKGKKVKKLEPTYQQGTCTLVRIERQFM